MLLLIHSPMFHLDHLNGELISSRRKKNFLLLSYGFPSSENSFQIHTTLTKQTTPNRPYLIPLNLSLTEPRSAILSKPLPGEACI